MSRRIALVFGIGKYEHYQPLKYSYCSVKEVFQLLISKEYGQCEPEPTSKLITDEAGEKITTSMMFGAIEEALSKLEISDEFIFYYSGHADLVRNSLFLIASGTKKPQDGFKFSTLISRLGQKTVTSSILIVDACHSEAMIGALQNWGDGRTPEKLGLLASAGYLQQAMEDDESGRTRFSKYFCEGIKNGCGGAVKDKITLDNLSKYIDTCIRSEYGELAQKSKPCLIGHSDDLWIAKRNFNSYHPDIEETFAEQKIVSIAEIIDIFGRDFVLREECDYAIAYLGKLLNNLPITPKNIFQIYKLRPKLKELIPRIENFRKICRSITAQAQADSERKRILSQLQSLNDDLKIL